MREAYLFTFFDRGETFAVRVVATSREAAEADFAAMSAAEKRAAVVSRLETRERDWVDEAVRGVRRLAGRLRTGGGAAA